MLAMTRTAGLTQQAWQHVRNVRMHILAVVSRDQNVLEGPCGARFRKQRQRMQFRARAGVRVRVRVREIGSTDYTSRSRRHAARTPERGCCLGSDGQVFGPHGLARCS